MNDDHLKDYRQKLEKAINEALTESPKINSIIHEIQDTGYDVFLIVEATVGFNEQSEEDEDQPSKPSKRQSSKVKLELTSQDERFLRQLKISPE
ncbi:MAG TPA: hypothetical protein VLV83_00295 [Acidobacteriota bacterium]|nr:hypothetical protein [Acidobacteriota bacterium]